MTYGRPLTQTPVKPAILHILLALSRGEMHGLGIADAVAEETAGEVTLGPATLYRSLRDMSEAGIVEPVATGDDDPRRKYYRLTAAGNALLEAEASRLARIVQLARERRVLGGGA